MNYFAKLPLRLRLVVVVSFLIGSIVVGILGRPSRTLLLASILLFLSGAWRISRARSFVLILILVPALVGLLLTHFDWHHPFLSRYSAGLFSVIAVLLLMDGVRIEEWIEMVRGKNKGFPVVGLGPLLIGTAVGTISLSSNIREQRACRKLANIYSWRAKSRASIFLDSIALPFYNAVESHEFIDEALRRWGARDAGAAPGAVLEMEAVPGLAFGNSNFTARLSDVNDFPYFTNVIGALLSATPIPAPWTRMISQLAKPARIMDIGDDSGQFATHLAERGFDVTVPADGHPFGEALHHLLQPDLALKATEGSFPEAAIHEWDHIFFHHKSFLEAVNRVSVRDLLERFHQLSHAGTRICFDYPATVMPASQGVIFSAHIDKVGTVDCRYSQHEQDHEMHQVWLEYTVRQAHEFCSVRVRLAFAAPPLSEVLAAAHDVGFSNTICPMPGAFSFLSGEVVFVELTRH